MSIEGFLSGPGPVKGTSGINVRNIRSVVSSSEMRLVNNALTPEGNDAQNDGLPDRLVHDVLDHSARDKVISSFLRATLQQVWLGGRGGEGKGSKRIHDEVNPK